MVRNTTKWESTIHNDLNSPLHRLWASSQEGSEYLACLSILTQLLDICMYSTIVHEHCTSSRIYCPRYGKISVTIYIQRIYAKACQSTTNFTNKFIMINLSHVRVSTHYIHPKKSTGTRKQFTICKDH